MRSTFTPSLSAQPNRFAARPKAKPTHSTNTLSAKIRAKRSSILLGGTLASLSLGSALFYVNRYGPDFEPFNQTQNVLKGETENKEGQNHLGALNELQSSQDKADFVKLYNAFSKITQSEAASQPALTQLSAEDLKTTQALLDRYQKMKPTTANCNQLYQEWATAVLLPRIGAQKTEQLKTAANTYFTKVQHTINADFILISAFLISLLVTRFAIPVPNLLLPRLSNNA